MFVSTPISISICFSLSISLSLSIYILCMYIYIYVYIYICIYKYICIYIYIYIRREVFNMYTTIQHTTNIFNAQERAPERARGAEAQRDLRLLRRGDHEGGLNKHKHVQRICIEHAYIYI